MAQPPGYYPDPDQPGMARWWDGNQWTAERAMNIRSSELEDIRKDVRFIRTVVLWWVVLTVLGVLFLIADGF